MKTPIRKYTVQEVFDIATVKVLEQGRPSRDLLTGACAYRGAEGSKCPIGWLIPDDRYDPRLERTAVGPLNLTAGLPAGDDPWVTALRIRVTVPRKGAWDVMRVRDFLFETQRAHDNAAVTSRDPMFRRLYAQNLRCIGIKYGLDLTTLDAAEKQYVVLDAASTPPTPTE